MPPDPAGSRPGLATLGELGPDPDQDVDATTEWYDRSSLRGDFLVMIAGQTEEDYLRKATEDHRCEFIDGIVYMPPNVHPDHQFDLFFLLGLIQIYHARRPIGVIQGGPTMVKLRDGCILEPDLFILPAGSREQLRADRFGRPPVLLAVEVLSPSTRSGDLDTKAALYREAGVEDIWFVDRRDRVVIVERREGDGYAAERVGAGPVVSRSLPGFWFDAAWLWAEPEPNMLECANRILAGPPGR